MFPRHKTFAKKVQTFSHKCNNPSFLYLICTLLISTKSVSLELFLYIRSIIHKWGWGVPNKSTTTKTYPRTIETLNFTLYTSHIVLKYCVSFLLSNYTVHSSKQIFSWSACTTRLTFLFFSLTTSKLTGVNCFVTWKVSDQRGANFAVNHFFAFEMGYVLIRTRSPSLTRTSLRRLS